MIFLPSFAREIIVHTAQKMKFSIKDIFSKCDQIRRKLWIWLHLLDKSLMENFIFCAVTAYSFRFSRLFYMIFSKTRNSAFLLFFINISRSSKLRKPRLRQRKVGEGCGG